MAAAPPPPSELEEQKKVLLPILQRASEIEAMEPRVAYYCRLYAIKRALEVERPAPEITGLIKALFAQCERDKPAIQPNEPEDRHHCEAFALNVFSRADRLDRAGRADLNTAKCFYAAAIFLQVLEQFLSPGEEMETAYPDLVEKARYAVWRAAELRKAAREGRAPAPPPAPSDAAAAAGGGAAGDLFAGPAYDASAPDEAAADGSSGGGDGGASGADGSAQHAAAPPPGGAGDSVASSTNDFLSLPHPPSTTPPQGSTGLLQPAAAAGPRFRPGSLVWVEPGEQQAPPQQGTVGQVVGTSAGPGGQALYKVGLPAAIQELNDSQLAPAVGAGERVWHVAAVGELAQPASVVAVQTEQWPCTFLLQLDSGRNLAATGGQLRLDVGAAVVVAPPPAPASIASGQPLPGAPPLVDPPSAPSPYQQQPGPPPPAAAAAAPAAPPRMQQQQQQPAPPPSGGAGVGAGGWSPAATCSALDAAVRAAQAGGLRSPSAAAVADAQKFAKWTKSSLDHDDLAGAVKCLADALKALLQQQ